ncbi:hypothetical protein TIFTF001_017314 [Ficus carica]|uniref:Uncharacterized protein n=1 Tax=Ficus carica TaxID=3494 RepID=A0AA88A4R7_FICCA|nr:hypothetical protein TIFTF001_017314 [Ficus carica]
MGRERGGRRGGGRTGEGGLGREEKREKGAERREERERLVAGDRPAGAGACGGGPEVGRRRPSSAAGRSPETEKTLGGKGNVR